MKETKHQIPMEALVVSVCKHLINLKKSGIAKLSWFPDDLHCEEDSVNIASSILAAMRITDRAILWSMTPLAKAIAAAAFVRNRSINLKWVEERRFPTEKERAFLFCVDSEHVHIISSYIEELLDVLTYESLDQIFKNIGLDPHEDWVRPNERYKHEFDEILYSTRNIPKNTVRELARINHWLSQWNFHAPEYGRAYRNGKNIYVLQENTGIAIFTIKRNGYEQYHYLELECNLEGWVIKGLNDGMVLINSIDRLMEDLDSRHKALEAFLQQVMGI